MNTLYVIGNGFDLAHGLKTSYSDFLLWYIKDFIQTKSNAYEHDDKLIKMSGRTYIQGIQQSERMTDILNDISNFGASIIYQKGFISNIFNAELVYNWVDIESEYFRSLQKILDSPINQSLNIKTLNNQFLLLKNNLERYLTSLDRSFKLKAEIKSHFKNNNHTALNKNLVVNFNYTSTIDSYIQFIQNCKLINIHGRLQDPKNPIIFGYSNTKNEEYKKVHSNGDIEFQKYIKIYNYRENNNYQAISDFINDAKYIIKILGHSCGLSDGDLLSTLFKHNNCDKIEICYYEKSDGKDDFSDKIRIIAKHIEYERQSEILEKIVSKTLSLPLIPYSAGKIAVFS